MKNRILRVGLVVLAVAGQAAAGIFVFRAEQEKAAARDRLVSLTRDAGRAQAMLADLRGAQAAMVVAGQDPSFWVPKLASLVQDATAAMKRLDQGALAVEPAQDLAAATDAVSAFARTTDRVRDLVATEQPLTASSVVFGDSAQYLSTAAAALASVAPSQAQAVDREAARVRTLEAYALFGAAALTLVVLLLLLPRMPLAPDGADTDAPVTGLGLSLVSPPSAGLDLLGRPALDVEIGRGVSPVLGEEPSDRPHESAVALVEGLRQESQLRLNAEPRVDLAAAARLCGDLARVKEGSELPALLARAAELLDASGIVVWMLGTEGTVLRPAVSHGYSDHTLAKMKALSGRAENAVSVAFRTGRMEVVRGAKDRNGAVVSPINTPAGCVGAMAAEVRHGAESSPDIQAVAAIVAAQLATLVSESTAAS